MSVDPPLRRLHVRRSPSLRLCFVEQGVEYLVKNQANRKEKISLLKDVSGVLYPGLMTALVRQLTLPSWHFCHLKREAEQRLTVANAVQMGPSGSGKTTLLGECL